MEKFTVKIGLKSGKTFTTRLSERKFNEVAMSLSDPENLWVSFNLENGKKLHTTYHSIEYIENGEIDDPNST